MSYLHLLSLIIFRLEEARFTREAEIRLISQHLHRIEEIREQRAHEVRQSLLRRATYAENQRLPDSGNAPIFQQEDQSDSISETSETANETASLSSLPELETHAEVLSEQQEFIEERGFLDVLDVPRLERNYIRRRINRRTQQQPRLSLRNTRARDVREPLHRPRDPDRERDARIARLSATADAIVLDILRDIDIQLTRIRTRVNNRENTESDE